MGFFLMYFLIVDTLSDEFLRSSLNLLILAMKSALLSSNLGYVVVVDGPFGVACGEKNILLTNNDSAYETVISLIQKGVNVEAIVDNREKVDSKLVYEIEKSNVKIFKGFTVTNTFGYKRINRISIMQLSKDGEKVIGSKINLKCE